MNPWSADGRLRGGPIFPVILYNTLRLGGQCSGQHRSALDLVADSVQTQIFWTVEGIAESVALHWPEYLTSESNLTSWRILLLLGKLVEDCFGFCSGGCHLLYLFLPPLVRVCLTWQSQVWKLVSIWVVTLLPRVPSLLRALLVGSLGPWVTNG